jgi:NAD(P)H-hydrate epimerase
VQIFTGIPRPPFDDLIQRLISLRVIGNSDKKPAIVSVDIRSGWHVQEGDVDGEGIKPDMPVSILLLVPAVCLGVTDCPKALCKKVHWPTPFSWG